MAFGFLKCSPVSVEGALETKELDGQFIVVHGVLYQGEGCIAEEFLCLPKHGPFDGVDVGGAIIKDRKHALLISEASLQRRMIAVSPSSGRYLYRYDAMIVGRIRRTPSMGYDVCMTDLLMMILQCFDPISSESTFHRLYVINFHEDRLPALPWTSITLPKSVAPDLIIESL